jgi:hypothetical protein
MNHCKTTGFAGRWPVAGTAALLALALIACALPSAQAQQVSAQLSTDSAAVGEPVEFRITTTGRSQAKMLDQLVVDGLEVVSHSDQFQMQMQFPGFGMQVTTTIRMLIVPQEEGEYSIPPLRLRLDGKVFKTLPAVLRVTEGGGMPSLPAVPVPHGGGQISPPLQVQPFPQPGTPRQPRQTETPRLFGEIVIPQDSAFVGEVVPVDLRFYIDARLPAQFSERPNFSGEGFTVHRTARPSEVQREIDGVPYACLVFRTAITPAKAGRLEIPAASLAARVQVPISRSIDDFFGGMLNNFGMSDLREVEITTDPVTIEVKPLPSEGRPEDFSGAVGDFTLETSASPTKAASGEPVMLDAVVSGQGNFEAMGPPALLDPQGWRVYDPAEDFEPSATDPIGLHGKKTYQFTLLALEDQTATPPVQFSFFDPKQQRYITLKGPPAAVSAQGSGQPTPTPAAQDSTAAATPQPGTTPPSTDGLSRDMTPAGFRPLAWSRGFVMTGILLAILWAAGLANLLVRRYLASPAAARSAHLRELRRSIRPLGDPSLPTGEFLEHAVKFLDARLGENSPPAPLDPAHREALDTLRALHGRATYSTQKPADLDPEARRQFLDALNALDKNLGSNV